MEGHDPARRDGNFFARLGIAARTLGFVAQLEIAEAGQLDRFAAFECIADFVKEGFHHVLGLALVQADLLEEQFGQLGLGQGRQIFFRFLAYLGHLHRPMQVGGQGRLQYRGINVVVINFPALPYFVVLQVFRRCRQWAPKCPCMPHLSAQSRTVLLLGRSGQRRHHGLYHIVLQSGLSILQAKAESKAFFVRLQPLAAIFIK